MRPSRSSVPSARKSAPIIQGNLPRRWPPRPCAEEEPASLAKELHGLSKIGERPGVEGIRERGAVDQYPIIVGLNTAPVSTSIPPSIPNVPGLGNVSSDESSGPATPPPRAPSAQGPPSRTAPVPRPQSPVDHKRKSISNLLATQVCICHVDLAPVLSRELQFLPRRMRQYLSLPTNREARDPSDLDLRLGAQSTKGLRRAPQNPQLAGPTVHDIEVQLLDLDPVNANEKIRDIFLTRPLYGVETHPHLALQHKQNQLLVSSPAFRLQRDLKRNFSFDEKCESGSKIMAKRHRFRIQKFALGHTLTNNLCECSRAAALSISFHSAQDIEVGLYRRRNASDTLTSNLIGFGCTPARSINFHATRSRATSSAALAPPPSRSASMTRKVSKSVSSEDVPPGPRISSRPPASVKFQEEPTSKPVSSQSITTRQPSPPQKPPAPVGLCLTPCPRSTPVAGHQDWYTLKGLTHLEICPTCMSQIAHSRYRDFFTPSLSKPPNQAVRCAFSNAWVRLAWTQMIKKQHDSLEMLYQMTRPPPGTRPCPGRTITDQTWHRVIDPDTGLYLPRFQVCGTCARKVRILMPPHRDTFHHCPEPSERVCDFVTNSPRFVQFIDLLDSAATRAELDPSRRPDTREFLSYARRKVVLRDCRRDRPTMSTWHYIPALPELSVCEDCYDEVVWPLAKNNHSIARMFSTSMRLLPGDGPNRCREATCQLYSARVRARFRDAVLKGDFPALKSVALRRFEAEQRFRDRREELLIAEKRGYDCDVEMKKAVDEWRRWE
ncbi:hypothetical protein N7481_007865 [Penicillium waksmanii]|uniref:uncharacterized protein n=1 Tax=Penicillium waksmanii TaxID=69791 RepID=UPI002546B0BA|nr:uncharacterized protein N7481_007865 [Penicillium waksmanii]KAJ5980567.1 hypothetical protein N7481_007865 [Penicillium waksmanii]